MRKTISIGLLAAGLILMAMVSPGAADPIIVATIGGAPSGSTLDNLDWLALGTAGGTSPTSGIRISFIPDGGAVQGAVESRYAAPWVSGLNGEGFGNALGPDTTTYISTGSNTNVPSAQLEIVFPTLEIYFGLLWGSIDPYNTLTFYNGLTPVFAVTGSDLYAIPDRDRRGLDDTRYVNIDGHDTAFNRVVATSSTYAFEIDNLAFHETATVPEPASLLLLGTGLVGMARWRRRRP